MEGTGSPLPSAAAAAFPPFSPPLPFPPSLPPFFSFFSFFWVFTPSGTTFPSLDGFVSGAGVDSLGVGAADAVFSFFGFGGSALRSSLGVFSRSKEITENAGARGSTDDRTEGRN